jgi:hypothetical protein
VESLRRGLIDRRARVFVISGMGGVGKTILAARLTRDVAANFHRVYWRSLRGAPSFSDWAGGAIAFLADNQRIVPSANQALARPLLELMRTRRCLLVLDNLDVLIQPGRMDGGFHPQYEQFADFLRAVASTPHASCVVLTSRDLPSSLVHSGAEVLELGGLGVDDARHLLRDQSLVGDERAWSELVYRYGGNGLALRLVAQSIRQLFDGDIASFMEQFPTGTFGGIRRLLETQMCRLSATEIEIVRLLAVKRQPASFAELSAKLAPRASRTVVLEAIEALRHRSMVELGGLQHGFRLPSVMLEYATDQLVGIAAS